MRENTDQNNSEYRHFLRSVSDVFRGYRKSGMKWVNREVFTVWGEILPEDYLKPSETSKRELFSENS